MRDCFIFCIFSLCLRNTRMLMLLSRGADAKDLASLRSGGFLFS